jgi:hypothetical protein
MIASPQPPVNFDGSSLTGSLLPIIRAIDGQLVHPDWSSDARQHWHEASLHLLNAVASIKRAELGIPSATAILHRGQPPKTLREMLTAPRSPR